MHLETRYLIPESIAHLERYVKTHPARGTLLLLGLFAVVLGLLRKVFGRISSDMILFALIIWGILILTGSSLYTLFHVKGFHFGG